MFQVTARKFTSVVTSAALAITGFVAVAAPAHAVGGPDSIAWIGTNNTASVDLQTQTLGVGGATARQTNVVGGAIAADATNFYFVQGSNLVKSSLVGGAVTTVAAVSAGQAQSLAVAGSTVYMYGTGGIYSVSAAGGTPTRFDVGAGAFSTQPWSWTYGNQIGATATDLYWVESDGVHKQALGGNTDSLWATNATMTGNPSNLGLWQANALSVVGGVIAVAGQTGSGMADFAWYDTTSGSPAWNFTTQSFNNWPTTGYATYANGVAYLNGFIYFTDGNGEVLKIDAAGTNQTTVFKDPGATSALGLALYTAPASATVTFDPNGGTGTMASQTASGSTSLNSNSFTKANHVFAYWSLTAVCSFAYNNGGSYPFSSNTTLYACWRGAGQLSETLNGSALGTYGFGNVAVNSSTTKTLFLKNVGDSTSLSGTISNYSISSGVGLTAAGVVSGSTPACNLSGGTLTYGQTCALNVTWNPTSAMTLTTGSHSLSIQFNGTFYDVTFSGIAAATKTVTFDANGGSGTMTAQVAATTTNLTANTLTRGGFAFAGWNTAANGSGTSYADSAAYTFAANTTLYAQWTQLATGGIDSSIVRLGPVVERQVEPSATTVTLTGFNLNKVSSVTINGVAAQFTVVGPGQIAVTLPKLDLGSCTVAVSGTGFAIVMPAAFRVVAKVPVNGGTGTGTGAATERTFAVFFSAGSYALSAKTIATLTAKLAALKAAAGSVVVTAWAQSTSNNKGDALLSANRAKAILGWLKAHGVKASAATGKGTLDASATSRRADVTYVTK